VDTPELTTARLVLRPLLPATAAALRDGDRDLAERLGGLTLPDSWPNADLINMLPLQAGLPEQLLQWGIWLIIEAESQTVIGSIGFLGPPDSGGLVEIGYDVIAERRRRGYLTEAAGALIERALDEPGVIGVVARCAPDNVASIRSLERLGFNESARSTAYLYWRLWRPLS
jgi:[ribosomal protein S5]-alanine N-acetyltransferase